MADLGVKRFELKFLIKKVFEETGKGILNLFNGFYIIMKNHDGAVFCVVDDIFEALPG